MVKQSATCSVIGDKMGIGFNMLGASMKHRVVGERSGTDVITPNDRSKLRGSTQFS